MRRLWITLIALLAAVSLVLSAGCQKKHLKDNPDEQEPVPGPEKPPSTR